MGLIQTASRLIARYGQPATIIRLAGFAADGAGGLLPATVELQFPVAVAVLKYDQLVRASSGFLADDLRILIAPWAQPAAPQQLDRIRLGAASLNIIEVLPFALNGAVIFWEAKARNG